MVKKFHNVVIIRVIDVDVSPEETIIEAEITCAPFLICQEAPLKMEACQAIERISQPRESYKLCLQFQKREPT